MMLKKSLIETPLGPMVAIADEKVLYLLDFTDRHDFEGEIKRFLGKVGSSISEGITPPIQAIQTELDLYFKGTLQRFTTPISLTGTPFQQQVWKTLQDIPYGNTYSYAELADSIGRPTAHRAVARANATNQLAIIVPCHRVIRTGGTLGGYAGGLARKEWLLSHEDSFFTDSPIFHQ
jgi:AraC family transcriptional regulator of adaptative response/methylated-DNA-[protein]-cysteine methyltransferase